MPQIAPLLTPVYMPRGMKSPPPGLIILKQFFSSYRIVRGVFTLPMDEFIATHKTLRQPYMAHSIPSKRLRDNQQIVMST